MWETGRGGGGDRLSGVNWACVREGLPVKMVSLTGTYRERSDSEHTTYTDSHTPSTYRESFVK